MTRVYVNDNPIGETEVYHANKHHTTTLKRWSERYIRETTPQEAVDEGLRPCKRCNPPTPDDYPTDACPSCGIVGEVRSPDPPLGYRRCRNDTCRVKDYKEADP